MQKESKTRSVREVARMGSTDVEYRVLGPLAVMRDSVAVDVGTYKQRALLALLLINANEVVSTDRIIDELWGEDAGSDRQNALWVNVSGLRGALEPERKKRTEGTVLLTRSPGYLMSIDQEDLDTVRFEQLALEGRALLEADPGAASLVLSEALALWRGHALEEFTYESFAQAEIARLEELRLTTVEDRVSADLRVGRSRELIGELEGLVRQHPLRERLTGHLMVALYRSGRQAEALRAFGKLKTRLGEELGLEPSTSVAELEERIVLDDPTLRQSGAAQPAGGRPEPGLSVRGYELREKIGEGSLGYVYRAYQPAVGREVAIKVIRPELANNPEFIRRFEAEAQLVAGLEHPQIVPLYDYWREPDAAFLVMRRFEHGSLQDRLDAGPLATATALQIIDQVGSALGAAHRRGVTHGDIKPDNVMIGGDGNAYLADFGLSVDGGAAVDHGSRSAVAFIAPEKAETGQVTVRSDVYSLALLADRALRGATGEAGGPDSPLVGPAAAVIGRATAVNPDERFPDVASFLDELRSALRGLSEPVPTVVEADNPYMGLRAFGEGDAGQFFGRERLVERLLARLGHSGPQGKLIAVVGPSGAGKSSVVRAGLIPAVRQGALPGSDRWFIVTMTPGHHPFEALEEALLAVAVNPPASVLELLVSNGIAETVHSLLPDTGSQLVLVVDQLEELFSHTTESDSDAFLSALAAVATDKHSPVKIVATLRADFYDHPLRHAAFGEFLRLGSEVTTPMSPDELERAVVAPAAAAGVFFEGGLVAQILSDMSGQSAALPLLQYALTELFEQRTGTTITADSYQAMGGVSAALVRRADNLYAGLDTDSKASARDLFLRLVTLGEASEDTRRRALLAELTDAEDDAVGAVLDTFGRHRLLSFDRDPITRGPTVEIAHEALLSEWGRLSHWIDNARSDIRAQRRLAAAAADWRERDQNPDFLLTGAQLNRYHGWLDNPPVRLTGGEGQFLQAGTEAEVAQVEERQRQARRDVTLRRRTLLLGGLAVLTAMVVGMALFAFNQRNRAEDLAAEAEASAVRESRLADDARQSADEATELADTLARTERAGRLTTASALELEDDPQLALLLALEAARSTAPSGEVIPTALDALHWALQAARIQYPTVEGVAGVVRPGPAGLTGVINLAPDELISFAQTKVTRSFAPEDCLSFFAAEACPDPTAPFAPGLSVAGGLGAYAGHPTGADGLAGTSVVVTSAFEPGFGFEFVDAALAPIGEATGITFEHANPAAPNNDVGDVARSSDPGDIIILPQPGVMADLANDGLLMDLSGYLDVAALRGSYHDYLLALSSVGPNGEWPAPGGSPRGVFTGVDAKSFLWNNKTEFDAGGYAMPDTWDTLLELSDEIVSDGLTPWCLSVAAGGASGWPATDWVESLVIRSEGPAFYDQWVRHGIPFDHPTIVAAVDRVGELAFGPGYVAPSPAAIAERGIFDAGFLLADGRCLMLPFANFAPFLNADLEVGVNLAASDFPVFDSQYAATMVGGGSLAVALTDRPEVRVAIQAMAQPTWGEPWAAAGDGFAFIPANTGFDLSIFPTEAGRLIAENTITAIASDGFRFDGSDSMPFEIGNAFLAGMVRYFQEGPESAESILAEIEATWVALESG